MSGNSWDEMRKAKEDSYFDKKNREALSRISAERGEAPRKSPITGEAMQKEVFHGVVIDRCPTSGGVWLDKGELEQILQLSAEHPEGEEAGSSWLKSFLRGLSGK